MNSGSEPKFLTRQAVDAIHEDQIERFGGLHGVRDENAPESAIAAAQNVYQQNYSAHKFRNVECTLAENDPSFTLTIHVDADATRLENIRRAFDVVFQRAGWK